MLRNRLSSPSSFIRFITLLLCYTLIAPVTHPSPPSTNTRPPKTPAARRQRPTARAGELLVRFRADATEGEKTLVVEQRGGTRSRGLRGKSGVEVVTLAPERDAESVATELRLHPDIEIAEPNYLITADGLPAAQVSSPDDPRFAEQWALRNNGGGTDIGATTVSDDYGVG